MSHVTENPRGGCVLAGINASLSAIEGITPIFHSGPGCCMQTTAAEQEMSGGKSAPVNSVAIPCSNMLEKEVVFGGDAKLRSTVQGAIEIIDSKAFFILTGCTAGIIGDDVESVAWDFRDQGHEVYAIETPGFYGDALMGYEVTWNTFLDQVITQGLPTQPDLVNVFGIVPYHDPFWSGNLEEIARILGRLGLRVNTFYTGHQDIETVRSCSVAALNIIVNPWLFKGPAAKFEEKFGVPSLRYSGLPVGATDTTAFVRAVAEALSLDRELVDRVIYEEEDYVYGYLEQAIGKLSWKRFAVIGDANAAVGITRYLANDYSFTPAYVIVSEQQWRKDDVERIRGRITDLEYARAPEVYFAADQYRIDQIIAEHPDVTLIVGSTNEQEAASYIDAQFLEATFPMHDRLVFNRSIAGYRGSLTLTEDLYDNL